MPPGNPDHFLPAGPDAIIVGSGRLTLDVIVRTGAAQAEPPRNQAGGTCGNVLADLAYLGWQAYPLTDIGDDDPGQRFCHDLTRWGVRLDLIRHRVGTETPVIVHHIQQTAAGAAHSFSSRCPFCNQRLRHYEPPSLASAEERLPHLPPARVFFFDRDSQGTLLLARHYRQRSALVIYEPNYAGPEVQFDDALAVAHVLKFARDMLPDRADLHSLAGPLLVVETQGKDGLRFRFRTGAWEAMPALAVSVVRDAAGAGDWCTAGLVHLLGRRGTEGLNAATSDEVRSALRFGQALAAWNCAFEGARGGIYRVERQRMQADVRRILAGEVFDPGAHTGPATLDTAGRFCRHCGCP
jgi:fructokinase